MVPRLDVHPASAPQLTRVPELWFEGGDVIIQAGSSLYRVFCCILAARSNVFKDMFESCMSLPQSEGATMDGVPFLKLQDAEEDVTHLLKAIFDYCYFEPSPYQTTFPTIVGVLRLSHKYDISHLRKRALGHLSNAFPNTIWLLDQRRQWAVSFWRGPDLLQAFLVIQLALEVSAHWLIPAAVYTCCMYSLDDILQLEEKLGMKSGPSNWTEFAAAQKLCISAWPKIRSFYQGLYTHLRLPICPNHNCYSGRTYRTEALSALVTNWATKNDMLSSLSNEHWAGVKLGLCKTCYRQSKKSHDQWRSRLWLELPKLMGFREWELLNKMGGKEGIEICMRKRSH